MLRVSLSGVGLRTQSRAYDVMGRPRTVSVTDEEIDADPVTRTFTHGYNVPLGQYTRLGPDDVETFVQLDASDRVQTVRRGPAVSPLMTASYTYEPNGNVSQIVYGQPPNQTETVNTHIGHLLWTIDHNLVGQTTPRLRLEYEYLDNDLPWRI